MHDVVRVDPGDRLNVRAGPSTQFGIIGKIDRGSLDVEVVDRNAEGTWAQVNLGELSGWTSLTYLAPQVGGSFPDVSWLACFGNEPFWSMDVVVGGAARFVTPGADTLRFQAGRIEQANGRRGLFGLTAESGAGQATMVLRQQACSDGSSDRSYGLDAAIVLRGERNATLSGCCSIAPK